MNVRQVSILAISLAVAFSVVPSEHDNTAQGSVGFTVSDKELGKSVTVFSSNKMVSIDNKDYYVEVKKSPAQKANAIYNLGCQFMGLEYVWGGTTPAGFDCSGFMQYIYGQNGVEIPRTAAEQYNFSTHIQPNQAKKGDLVFFYGEGDDADRIVHVGMYLGKGKFLQSGGPPNNVNESTVNIYGSSIVFGRVL